MFAKNSSFIDFQSAQIQNIEELFSFSESLKKQQRPPRNKGEYAILAFFEASTRTRLSFEAALARAGIAAIVFDGGLNTSLEKGETIQDSILNMAAMNPRLMIVRCGQQVQLDTFANDSIFPVLNAGWGIHSHPSQALLDLFTLKQKWGSLRGKKLLIIGDVKHSRVASSHLQIGKILGLEIAQCGPKDYLRNRSEVQTFDDLGQGLVWADAIMALRFQFERHSGQQNFNKEEFRKQFGINANSLARMKSDTWVLHPGPINHGIEIESEVLGDARCLVMNQVNNGVYIREALVRMTLGEKP